jgi:asparagine synthase (glutamine-hydrolysing)
MSAIFGVLRLDGGQAPAGDLERMGAILAHRSPDGRRTWTEGPLGLGHGLMRVTEEDWLEAQPLRDVGTGIVLVADLRLDNREELAAEFDLGPEALERTPDSALVMQAYKRWGEACAEHLLGDFAFALWDGRARKLVLGRDHMGQRTLFYSLQKETFVFATELKALWAAPEVPRVMSEAAIARRLLAYPRGPVGVTHYEGISGLARAMVMTVDAEGRTSSRVYWKPQADPRHEGRNEAYYVKAYRDVLGEAVACRLHRNLRPAALLLSGGYDSAGIAGLAGPVLQPRGRKLICVSAALPEDYRGPLKDVRPWVEMCRRHMPHLDVRYFVRTKETLLDGLEETMEVKSQPASPGQHVWKGLYRLAAQAGARVVMDGYGGDYTLNPRGYESMARFLRTGQFRRFLAELPGHSRHRGMPVWRVVANTLRRTIPAAWLRAFDRLRLKGAPLWTERPVAQDFIAGMFADGVLVEAEQRGYRAENTRMRAVMQRVLDLHSTGPNSAGSPQAATLGMDLTLPFHDKRVVELGLAIPEDLYVKDGRIRHLACEALKDLYPPEFQTRVWRPNDSMDPDFHDMVDSIEPELLAEVDRLSRNERLSRYVDFPKLKAMLEARRGAPFRTRHRNTAFALNALLIARHIDWFERSNS